MRWGRSRGTGRKSCPSGCWGPFVTASTRGGRSNGSACQLPGGCTSYAARRREGGGRRILWRRESWGGGERVTYPWAERLFEVGRACQNQSRLDMPAFLGLGTVFPERLVQDATF